MKVKRKGSVRRKDSVFSSRAARPLILGLGLCLLVPACAPARSGILTPPPISREYTPPPQYRPPVPPPPPRIEPARARVQTVELGRSVNGVPLIMEVFGDGPDHIFIFGGIHGSEPTGAYVARELANYLRGHGELCAGKTVAILAAANPDGLQRGTRANARGVDINRNFPASNWRPAGKRGGKHGAAPASEPETRALQRALEIIQPRRVVSIHATVGEARHCNNYDGPAAGLASLMARYNRYPVTASMGYATYGSFGSYAGVDRRIPTITLELPVSQSGSQSWGQNREALLAFIRGQ
jgi:murein peptide amidase A